MLALESLSQGLFLFGVEDEEQIKTASLSYTVRIHNVIAMQNLKVQRENNEFQGRGAELGGREE